MRARARALWGQSWIKRGTWWTKHALGLSSARPATSSQNCSHCGCLCSTLAADYPYRSSEDYHRLHPAVSVIAKWRRSADKPPPDVYRSPDPCKWRVRARLAVGRDRVTGSALVGLFKVASKSVVSANCCAAHHPVIDAAAGVLEETLGRLRDNVPVFDHRKWKAELETPSLRNVQLTVERSTNKVQLVLVWNARKGASREAVDLLVDTLWSQQFSGASTRVKWHSIWIHWRDPDPWRQSSVFSPSAEAWEQVRPCGGARVASGSTVNANTSIQEVLDGLPFSFGPAAFMQANLGVFEQVLRDMKAAICRLAASEKDDSMVRILELHSGVGVIGLSLAHSLKESARSVNVLSTDGNPHCAPPYAFNAQQIFARGTWVKDEPPCRFLGLSDVDSLKLAAGLQEEAFDVLVLDPPRRGLARRSHGVKLHGGAEVAAKIRGLHGLKAIIYMSCGHQSFMEDADRLTGAAFGTMGESWGAPFRLVALSCYDMFPFTEHVETLGIFVR